MFSGFPVSRELLDKFTKWEQLSIMPLVGIIMHPHSLCVFSCFLEVELGAPKQCDSTWAVASGFINNA